MNYLNLSKDKLDIEKITALATSSKCGAISAFIGTTRDNFDGKEVVRLEYEAYESMALKYLEKICEEIRNQWKEVENIVIYHRLGCVPVKEASVAIAISSPHRKEAIQATEYCIDAIKKTVTIWKKEFYSDDDEGQWKENKESLNLEPETIIPTIPAHYIQVRATKADIEKRITQFAERKREEINVNNIKEFCGGGGRDRENSCARIDATLPKRKDSKGHLQVSKVLNTYHRDQTNSDYMTKYIPANGVEERLTNLEIQLSLSTTTPAAIYERLKNLEDRMLYLEAISPEYIRLWDKVSLPSARKKKKIFTIEDIDSMIADVTKQIEEKKTVYSELFNSTKNIYRRSNSYG